MMKLSFESDILMPTISTAIRNLTDNSIVCLDKVHYDEVLRIIDVYLQRREIKKFKRSIWGGEKKVFGQAKVKSLLRIKQVERVDIDVDNRLVTEHNSCFTVLFGVQIDSNEVYLGSLEESQGKLLCQIRVQVKKMDIEYVEAVEEL